jgi:hypothetical protein
MNKTIVWLAGIIIAALLVYLTVLRVVPSPTPQDDMVAVQCSGKTVYRYKDAATIFPVIIQSYNTSFSAATGVLGKLAGDSGNTSASADIRSAAQSLMDTLNQDNIFFQNMLKAYFLESNDDPCNDSLRYQYTAFIQQMTDKQIQLKQFIAEATSQPANTGAGSGQPSKVLAVVDTAKGKVEAATTTAPTTKQAQPNKLVVVNDYKKLNSAVAMLSKSYRVYTKPKKLMVNVSPANAKK